MSASLGSLRRVLPLANRLAGAPGVLRQYSDLASGVPGRGRGGGGHASADGNSEAPGSRSGRQFFERPPTPSSIHETAPADSRYEEGEDPQQQGDASTAARRQPVRRAAVLAAPEAGAAAAGPPAGRRRRKGSGRMAQLVAGTEKEGEGREEEDGEEEGDDSEAAVTEAGPRRERRMGSRASEGGLNPREALAEWLVELPDLAQPGKVGATLPAADLLTYEELGMDPSRLWLLKYVLGPSTLARLQQGAVGAEELDEIADKLLCTMIPSSEEQEGQTRQYLQTNWDPHYRLMDGVGATPAVGPHVGRSARKAPTAGAMMDEFKEELMDMMQMDEEEYEWHKREVAEEWGLVRKVVRFNLPKDQEDRVERLFARSVPADHPMYGTIRQKLDVVQSNAQWPGDRKLVFAKRLIKTLTGAKQL